MIGCDLFVDGKCTDDEEYIDAISGDSCCGRRKDAIRVECDNENDILRAENQRLKEALAEAQAIIKAVRPYHICGGQSDYHDALVSDYCEKEFDDND